MESSNTNITNVVEIAKSIMNKIGEKITALSLTVGDYFNKYLLGTMILLYACVTDPSSNTDIGKTIKYVLYLCCFLVLISIITISIPYYTYKMETSGKDVSISGKYKDYLDTYITTLIWIGVFLLILVLSYVVHIKEYISGKSIIRLIGISGLGLTGASIVSIFQALPFINIKRSMII
jgi:hypothetical protein